VAVNYKAETVFNTLPGAAGARRFRLTGGGLRLGRSNIDSAEFRSDGQSNIPRLGSRSVSGSYTGELSVGTFDPLFEALLRGTWTSDVLIPGTTPIRRSFTFEENEQDLDQSQVFTGCRVSSARVSCPPDANATVDFGIVGADMQLVSGAAAPYFTTPTVTATNALVATDAAITLDGVAILELTACDFSIDIGAAGQPVIGSNVTPDIFERRMRISGSVSAVRKDAALQTKFLAETSAALSIKLTDPAAAISMTFTLPKILFTDYSGSLGSDGAYIGTIPFTAGYDTTVGGMIKLERDLVP